jgi:hypothetical protein
LSINRQEEGMKTAILALVFAVSGWAQQFNVKVLNRQNNETGYSYVVPGYSTSTSTASANCFGGSGYANCSGSGSTTTSSAPAFQVSYQVRGATFSLKIPDGRVAVVNCNSKLNWTEISRPNQVRRSCRIPPFDDIEADFSGDKAKLKWVVSLDGKKMESETYKIVAVLPPPTAQDPAPSKP